MNADPCDTRSSSLDLSKLRDALDKVRSTLEHLTLSINFFATDYRRLDSGGSFENGNSYGIRGGTGSLAPFEKLQSLEISSVLLLGWSSSPPQVRLVDILPQALNSIVFRNDMAGFDHYVWEQGKCPTPVIEYLVEAKAHTPELESVTMLVNQYMDENDWGKEAEWEFEGGCEDAGVSCKICKEAAVVMTRTDLR